MKDGHDNDNHLLLVVFLYTARLKGGDHLMEYDHYYYCSSLRIGYYNGKHHHCCWQVVPNTYLDYNKST